MKKLFTLFIITCIVYKTSSQNVGIGTPAPNNSAMLDISSTSRGLLIPRMTAAQRQAIASPAAGLMVYETTSNSFQYYNGSQWAAVAGTAATAGWTTSGTLMYSNNNGNVGIGTATPAEKLHVVGGHFLLAGGTQMGGGPSIINPRLFIRGIGPIPGIPTNFGINFQLLENWLGSISIENPNDLQIPFPSVMRFSMSGINENDLTVGTSGRVGIGTRNPFEALHVVGNIYTNSGIRINDGSAILQLQNGGVNKGFMQLSGDNVRLGTNAGNTGNLVFRLNGNDLVNVVNNNGAAQVQLMAGAVHRGTLSAGNTGNIALTTAAAAIVNINNQLYVNSNTNRVGVGTSAPDEKLHVDGNLRLNGNLSQTGNISTTGNIQNPLNGNVNMLPIAYGRFNASGTKIAGTNNITVTNSTNTDGTQYFRINVPGVNWQNAVVQITMVHPYSGDNNPYGLNPVVPHCVYRDNTGEMHLYRININGTPIAVQFNITVYQ